ncbi:MAG: TetR/AcrR family transcriptional regulator C-terminal domain-containing protein [Oscillospiraceae bacterium]
MERKSYPASLQTKQTLASALKELMAQKPMEKISIQEITALCGMRRQNFYYHFEDIYDLMRWMFQQEAVSLLQKREGALLWQEGILLLFQYLEENRAVCLCALNSLGRDTIKRFFNADIYAVIGRTITQMAEEVGYADETSPAGGLKLLTHFYVVSLAGIMESWLLGEIDQSPQELVDFFDLILKDFMRGAELRLGGKEYLPNHHDC